MNIKNRIKVSISNIPKAVKPIPGIQDSLITRSGRVFLKERGVWYEIIPKINKGRLRLTIRGKNGPLHRLLALAWIINPKPNEYNIVRHLDDNPLNNKLSNLRWGTPKMNLLIVYVMEISFYPSLGMVKRIIYMVKEVLNPLGR